jgi:hypothetical protein
MRTGTIDVGSKMSPSRQLFDKIEQGVDNPRIIPDAKWPANAAFAGLV